MTHNPNRKQALQLYELSDRDRCNLHRVLLEMYDDIFNLCNEHALVCMLGGGSCLGAVRHQGFIPWDDDLDLMMPRKDYNVFVSLCIAGKLGDKYEFSVPSKDCDSKNTFLKIYKKNTINIELYDDNTPFPKGIYIDIFPMESAPVSRVVRGIKGAVSGVLRAICNSVLFAQYTSVIYENYLSEDYRSWLIYKVRYILGSILGIVSHKKWVYWFDKFNASTDLTGFTTIPTGRKNYIGECMPNNVFYPVSRMLFAGRMANVPNDYDRYLKNLYGDYMRVPAPEKRERHLVYKFKCD